MAQHDSTYLTVTSRTGWGMRTHSIGVTKCIAAGISEVAVHDLVCCVKKSWCHHFAAPSCYIVGTQSRVLIIFKSHHPTQDKIQRKILSNTRYNPTNCHPTTKYLATMKLNSAILLITVLSFSADHACEFCVYLCMDIYEIEWCRHYYRPSSHIVKMILIASFYMFVHTLFSCKATLHSWWRASTPSK